ncbi:N-acetylglucosamine-6-phosphate deacetylase [Macrococcus brunensis]|uniref:N-acetylglucosamine-6-phosphate deacetylase n=1 Tax=Macrococcus brunensis TaxID=198483 RepID=UPI001EEF847A|nr:N-acetylglucosamine-6-phosphate deacetylase [Macrococcus brunensis]ULG72880.1 N-acetylglucosamine-6-phosphate deacetylase [Macrococcus brunensis]
MSYVLMNGTIHTENGTVEGHIIIEESHIKSVQEGPYSGPLETIDLEDKHVLPGFIDIHIHGGYGEDFMDANALGLHHLSKSLLSEGTTSYLATTMTQSRDAIMTALETLQSYHSKQLPEDAEMLGIHLEGPFISPSKVGAQNPAYVQKPTIQAINDLQDKANGLIKVMTFAPEVIGAEEVLQHFKDDIIFSIGHTTADFDQLNQAADFGAKHITHLYNAATPFQHRAPGAFGAAWLNDQLSAEVIVDGVHSHPASVAIAYRMKGRERFYLITDAMRAKGMSEGTYDLGGQDVIVKNQTARLSDGTLAGSILKMNDGLRLLKEYTGRPLAELWPVTSFNQAKALGIADHKGSIAPGKDADLVILDDDCHVQMTIKNGYRH